MAASRALDVVGVDRAAPIDAIVSSSDTDSLIESVWIITWTSWSSATRNVWSITAGYAPRSSWILNPDAPHSREASSGGALVVFLGGMIMKARRMPVHSGRESLVGMKGTTRSRLDPRGAVLVEGERWDAIAEHGEQIDDGTPIIVTRSEGFLLYVKRDPAFVRLLPPPSPAAPSQEA